ncbi:MAG: hypothetical protein ACOH1Q_10325 [Thiobacillus sp.]|nr:hypothetical protein [Thiobacillus sp.]
MKLTTGLLLVPALVFGLSACDVKQTQEGQLPDVEVKGGQVPKYDVDAGDVDVKMEKKVIEVPTVEVDTPAQDQKEDGTK